MIRGLLARIIAATDFPAPKWLENFVRQRVGSEITALEVELAEARVKHADDPARIREIERDLATMREQQAGFPEPRA